MAPPLAADTVHGCLAAAAALWPANDLFVVPERLRRAWELQRASLNYAEALARVDDLAGRYRRAGYGPGHRVALLLENRPAHFLHWLALNRLGASVVPLNPDLRDDELHYLLSHSESALLVALPARLAQVAGPAASLRLPVIGPDTEPPAAPQPSGAGPAGGGPIGEATECALLYTSGTTGRPKGCLLSNRYFLGWAEWYAAQRGLIALRPGLERLLQPLPTFHVNAMGNSFMGMLATGGAQVILDRFHPRSWWDEAVETRATCFHYLGVMPAFLLALDEAPEERAHGLRFGMGGGASPAHHAAFETRFGVPLLEGWAMTETGGGGILCATTEPRHVGSRCIGRAERDGPPLELRVVAEDGSEAAVDAEGELLVRAAGPEPRRRFFSAYLKDEAATETIWRGGWLNTGDVVRRGADGAIHFVDRKKNIIRRSGENIAAVEVEAALAQHPAVAQVAVLAVEDALRGEEVLAVVAPKPGHAPDADLARALAAHCRERLTYYKAPGWIAFRERLPTTSTQKVRKVDLGDLAGDPAAAADCFDLRALKTRRA